MLIECLLVCAPQKGLFDEWRQVLASDSDKFSWEYYDYSNSEVYKALLHYIKPENMLSPTPGLQACAGLQLNVELNRFILHGKSDQVGQTPESVLVHPEVGHGYLFFNPCDSHRIALTYCDGFVVNSNNSKSRFERISKKEYSDLFQTNLDDLSSFVSFDSRFAKALWKAVSGTQGSLLTLERSASPVNGAVSGWIRPFIIRLRLDGDQYNEKFVEGKNSASNALHKLLKSKALKFVQPIIARSSDVKYSFFQKWWERICRRVVRLTELNAITFTVIERLVFCPSIEEPPFQDKTFCDRPWYPFFILDHLGGSFHIKGLGEGSPEFFWCPPAKMAPNLRWFADYWVGQWGGKIGDSSLLMFESFGAPRLPRLSRRQRKGLLNLQTEIDLYLNSVEKVLKDHPESCSLGPLQQFLLDVFSSPELRDVKEFQTMHKDSIEVEDEHIYFHTKLFVESACRSSLLPASPIRIQPPLLVPSIFIEERIPDNLRPHVDYENNLIWKKAFDIVEDSGGGAEGFLNRIITAEPNKYDKTPMIVPFPTVWWLGKWVDLAASAPSNVMFYLTAKTVDSFILGVQSSLLGDQDLSLGNVNSNQSRCSAQPPHNVNIFYA